MASKYASLYIQSEYSLLSSNISINKLKQKADLYEYKALAITDNAMHGAYKFYNALKDTNIKAIIGLRLSLYNENIENNVLLYAKDFNGYKNLLKISTKKEINPSEINLDYLREHNEGILAIIPIIENELYVYYKNREYTELNSTVLKYKDTFEDLYFGISFQTNESKEIMPYFIDIASRNNVKAVAINRTNYFDSEDLETYKILYAINKNIKEEENKEIEVSEYETNLSFLTSTEMELLFNKYLNLLNNTNEIIDKCNLVLPYSGYYFPKATFENMNGQSKEYLFSLCKMGLNKRLKKTATITNGYLTDEKIKEYKDRLIYELSVIDKMGFNDYFLIVYDYVKYAKTHDIYVGPGRGSAGGSLISYSLGITEVDPVYYNLLFERFLNPERVGMPDIDVDFEDDRRGELISYLGERYGLNKVAHITAFGTYKSRLAIRDVSRIIKLSDNKLKEVMKYISADLSIDASIASSNYLSQMVNGDEDVNRLIRLAKSIEGLPKNYTTHASGIIMADSDLTNYTALQTGIDGVYQTQFEADDLSEIGLVKMDILGIRNLSIIKHVIRLLKSDENIDVDIRNIPLDDKDTFKNIAYGNTLGIFQLESAGVTKLLQNLKTSSIDDIINATALYRPGPMEMIPSFIARKFKREEVTYLDPSMEESLKSTYGIMVYQEQVMQVASAYAGYTLGEADILRRAMSKKKQSVIEAEREKFVTRAINKGHDKKQANKVYDYIEKFASYGFNKSHAVAYAIIAYQMAYLKTKYYKAFACALMTNCIGSINSLSSYIMEARRNKVNILAPSVNKSAKEFVYDKDGIYYSLLGIANLGNSTVDELLRERENGEFKSYYDFVNRTRTIINKALFTNLVYSGAMDEFVLKDKISRKQMINEYDDTLQKMAYSSLLSLDIVSNNLDSNDEFNFEEMSINEKVALGFNLKYDIFIKYQNEKIKYHAKNIKEMIVGRDEYAIVILKNIKEIKAKTGNLMAFLIAYDGDIELDSVVFSESYEKYKPILEVDAAYLIKAKLDNRNDKLQLVISDFHKLH